MTPDQTAHAAATATIASELDTDFFKALAEPTRVAIILKLAANNGQEVDAIAQGFPQDRSVISRHLAALHDAGILERKPQGRHVVYRLRAREVLDRLEGLVALLRRALEPCCRQE